MLNEPSYSTPQRTPLYPGDSRTGPGWAVTLIVACLALGFCASAVEYERTWGGAQQRRAESLGTSNALLAGQLEDLGRFLADPQTHVIRLSGDGSLGHAAIAWNAEWEKGYLLCDQLQTLRSDMPYELWARRGSQQPIRLAGIHPKSGQSVYPFSAGGVKSRDRLEITAGPPSPGNLPILTGEFE